MIGLPAGTKVFLACQPIDLRAGLDGLAAKVQQIIGADPFSGHVFIFRSKRGHYLKGLYWDGSGMCLFAKRLERHKFVWPPIVDGTLTLTPAQLALLVEAMDWRRTIAPPAKRSMGAVLDDSEQRPLVWAEHREILRRVLAGDAAGAECAARHHTDRAGVETPRRIARLAEVSQAYSHREKIAMQITSQQVRQFAAT
jgi:transposase